MRTEHVDWQRGVILVEGKGRRQRYVAPGPTALAALRCYLGGRTGPVWLGVGRNGGRPISPDGMYQALRRIGARAGVEKVYAHKFRTTWANLFMEATGDLDAAQVLLGHAKVQTTIHYASWSRAERALAVAQRVSVAERIAG